MSQWGQGSGVKEAREDNAMRENPIVSPLMKPSSNLHNLTARSPCALALNLLIPSQISNALLYNGL